MENIIFGGQVYCQSCGRNHELIKINDDTTIREFSQNYYLYPIQEGCHNAYEEDGRYSVLIKYSEFMNDPNKYIDEAFEKTQQDISNRVHWRDIEHIGS